jgi:hypothetical protein
MVDTFFDGALYERSVGVSSERLSSIIFVTL